MYILGISAFYHDSAACLLRDGYIVAAAQEERFTRKKQDSSFPINAIKFCLKHARITFDDIHFVGFYEKSHLKFERIIATYAAFFPKGFYTFQHAIPVWFTQKLWLPNFITSRLISISPSKGHKMKWDGRLIFSEHHIAHAASAYFPSPFTEAAILTMDGVGEWATTSLSIGQLDSRKVPKIHIFKEIHYPDSLGMLYSAFTYYLGFKVNSGEYKVMGLAPYGVPKYIDHILNNLIDVKEDGSYSLNTDYFSFPYDYVMINPKFCTLFNLEPRTPETLLTQKHFNIAASIQKVTEQVIYKTANYLYKETKMNTLCMAGGVALNCVANGLLWRDSSFQDIWIQPAAGDAGGALGIAFYIWHEVLEERKVPIESSRDDLMQGAFLGPNYSSQEIIDVLTKRNIKFTELKDDEIPNIVSELLVQEMIVGWFQGRMEFGPRALGARSILGDPRSKKMQGLMNLKIKYRESFRPFAAAVLRERVSEWFDLNGKEQSMLGKPDRGYTSPYMLMVASVKNDKCFEMTEEQNELFGIDKLNIVRSEIPACTHVDYSCRIQTVDQKTNLKFYTLIKTFEMKTGVPILVNTSFNIRGEPIVCSPDEALNCFLGTEMDALIIENCLILKSDILNESKIDYKNLFDLD